MSINNEKKELRKLLLAERKLLNPGSKALADSAVFEHFIKSGIYSESDTLLIFYSMPGEVKTLDIIRHALADGKTAALPVCGKNSSMEFYRINGLDELAVSAFGIPAPVKTDNAVVPDDKTLCILPGLSFDKKGFRIGYGGGYYDRYLAKYNVKTAGLCYDSFIAENLPHDEFDIKADSVLTESGFVILSD